MPPRALSRHRFTLGIVDLVPETTELTERVPYTYRDLPDNLEHLVTDSDTLQHLAARYYEGAPDAAQLWWVIADFQPDPIHDPTLRLTPGSKLIIPSLRTVFERVLSERRRGEGE